MDNFKGVKPGLALAVLTLLFGVAMAVVFGVAEDAVKGSIQSAIAQHPALHDAESFAAVWGLWRLAHFYGIGGGAVSLALICVAALSSLRRPYKLLVSVLTGLTGLYPVALLLMALLAPSAGISGARGALSVQFLVYVALISFLIAITMLVLNIFIGNWSTCNAKTCGLD
ncbi:hypothetical protein MNBD_DELTA01-1202 [hydrothermal vent metagenome]|uniref:Uncharacterized protein n=1 Tax=hydrothermal vent metagenome TaxID=652676 RepID=A0A3B0R8C5_9ZZZZ